MKAVTHFHGRKLFRGLHTVISEEVNKALDNRLPVLALESTIITHGLPNPENLNMAKSVESICRERNVTPATIAVMKGKVCVGLTKEELAILSNGSKSYVKISRRDLASTIQQGLTGGTTVSGTMLLASQHNINVFATGGIGGVHRGGENTLDVSADLTELGRTSLAVVCAGVKSILDIPRTLEYLETQGVTVATLGRTRDFPAFFTAKSGCLSHTNVQTAREAAEMIHVNKKLNLGSGIVIAVPIPNQFAADGQEIEAAIQTALSEAESGEVVGNAITPFILKRVSELTSGRSLKTNLALVRNNVTVGSQIALELSIIEQKNSIRRLESKETDQTSQGKVLVVGAVNVDIVCYNPEEVSAGKDLACGTIKPVMGGVARNVAECLVRCGVDNTFISVVGDDRLGRLAIDSCRDVGMLTSRIFIQQGAPTPVAQLLLKDGNVTEGIADFSSHSCLTKDLILESDIKNSGYVVLDCDTPLSTGLYIADLCYKFSVPLVLEPTAPLKFKRYIEAGILSKVSMVTPNRLELALLCADSDEHSIALSKALKLPEMFSKTVPDMVQCLDKMSKKTQFRSVLTTLGEDGSIYCQLSCNGILQILHLPSTPIIPTIKSTSGAGDSFLGGFLSSIIQGKSPGHSMKVGTFCAYKSVESYDTISEHVNLHNINETIKSWEGLGWDVEVLFNGNFS